MAFTHYILVFFIIRLSFSPSHASLFSDAICSITPYPNLCKTLLPRNNSIDIYDSGRLSIQLSLSTTSQIINSINDFLNPIALLLPKSIISALQDCQFLLGLNIDLLSNAVDVAKKPNNSLENTEADDAETWLSATITNKQTCLDGLQVATSNLQVANLVKPLISKALFKKGWNPGSGVGDVISWSILKIRQKVVVNPDGTGDYTTINDAIAAAPSNSLAGEGYYQIYVVAGVYHEYVSIAANNKYLMMVGDGIDKTIITGNRNVPDGWTTFNCATFAVDGQGFVAMNITFKNTAGAAKFQAVAVRNSADLSAFYSCSFEGYQDTLFTHSLRQFYKEWDFALSTLYYAEYKNIGPGSNTSNRVTWPGYRGEINFMDASCFTVSNFILGHFWLPWTGVPYTGGLYL
ncbi:hypothetical protein RND71_000753 [Anisodus tanguticus]|uniref:Pectinesterase inhibitor domain-containing protein n=1 Tax=Anisodus tanguticus TaxID=243964 RepID=A0AAE1T1R6_9SOLA|nr:hypothetical protein RND71_000753 [Anisodus tanguticus]